MERKENNTEKKDFFNREKIQRETTKRIFIVPFFLN